MSTTITSPELKDLEERLTAKRNEIRTVLDEAGPELDMSKIKALAGTNTEKVAAIREWNTECDDLAAKAADIRDVLLIAAKLSTRESVAGEAGTDLGREAAWVTVGERFADALKSSGFRAGSDRVSKAVDLDDVHVKTLLDRATGAPPESTRSGLLVDNAQRPIQVADLYPQMPWGQAAYKYMEETTFTNAAAGTAEGGTFAESALVYTERSSTIEKISTFLPVTDEALEDNDYLAARLNQRLPFMIRQKLDTDILNANGTTPNLRGLLNVAGIQTQAKGADPTFDAILKASVKVATGTGQAFPHAVIMAPVDVQNMRLLRTADGIYLLGNPQDPAAGGIWGLTIVQAQALAAGTAIVGDWNNYAELLIRRGITVQVSNSHGTFFVEGKQAVRADIRVGLVHLRPAAFCTVTGL